MTVLYCSSCGDAIAQSIGWKSISTRIDGGAYLALQVRKIATKVHLKLQFDFKVEPLFNVIAVMKGSEFPKPVDSQN